MVNGWRKLNHQKTHVFHEIWSQPSTAGETVKLSQLY